MPAGDLLSKCLETGSGVIDAKDTRGRVVEFVEPRIQGTNVDVFLLFEDFDAVCCVGNLFRFEAEGDPPKVLICFSRVAYQSDWAVKLGATGAEETRLFDADAIDLFGDGEDGISNMLDPDFHVFIDGDIGSFAEGIPEVLRRSIPVGPLLQVITDSLQ